MQKEKSVIFEHPTHIGYADDNIHHDIEIMASMCMEAVYVIDFLKKGFYYVADRDFFLNGYSVEEVKTMGFDFFHRVVHKKDLTLLRDIYEAIINRMKSIAELDEINYFSFCVRLRNSDHYLMVHHKLKPLYNHGKLRLGICLLSISAMETPGHLRLYYPNFEFEAYSTSDRQWTKGENSRLSKREQAILRLVKEGNTNQAIADKLCIGLHTLQNDESSIYRKLHAHSMREAITIVTNLHLLFPPVNSSDNKPKTEKQKERKPRKPMTPEKLPLAQDYLNQGYSKNQVAKNVEVSEFTIRYHLKKGNLVKK